MYRITTAFYSGLVLALQQILITSCQQIHVSSSTKSPSPKVPETVQKETTPYVAEPGKENLRYGFIDRKGQFAIPPKFKLAGCFKGGLASVITDEGHAYINRSGHFVTKPGEYITGHGSNCDDKWPNYSEGLYSVTQRFRISGSKNNSEPEIQSYFGYVNSQGKLVISLTPYLQRFA